MQHLLIEFITGGGLVDQALPKSLQHEGELMLTHLAGDLIDAGQKDILITRDVRLASFPHLNQVTIAKSLLVELPQLIKADHMVWLIAPEQNDSLALLSDIIFESGAHFFSCSLEAIRLTGSKIKTSDHLNQAGIDSIATVWFQENIPESANGWIIKPDDGAGGVACRWIKDFDQLQNLQTDLKQENLVVQPYIPGYALSMSLLVKNNRVILIACNRQYIDWQDGEFNGTGIGINECVADYYLFESLAKNIIKAIPGLSGFVGVDMIKTGEALLVVEINPRLTTAYTGLSESLNRNMAQTMLNLFQNNEVPDINLGNAKPVKIYV